MARTSSLPSRAREEDDKDVETDIGAYCYLCGWADHDAHRLTPGSGSGRVRSAIGALKLGWNGGATDPAGVGPSVAMSDEVVELAFRLKTVREVKGPSPQIRHTVTPRSLDCQFTDEARRTGITVASTG